MSTDKSSTLDSAAPIDWTQRVLDVMATHYGARFFDQWRGVPADAVKRAWTARLSRLKPREIQRGLGALEVCKFPPTLPEFVLLCRPQIDHEAVFHEAVEQMHKRHHGGGDVWSTAVVYWAATRLGEDLRRYPYSTLRGRWRRALAAVEKDIEAGELPNEVPLRRPLLSKPVPPSTREFGRARLQEIKQSMGMK